MITLNNSIIESYLADKGITVPAGLKLIGIRGCVPIGNPSSGQVSLRGDVPNIFSDTLGCFGSDFGFYEGTTLPGEAPSENPHGLGRLCTLSDPAGKPWQFKHWMHHGQYPCLIQDGEVSVRRDDNYLDTGADFAVEMHYAGIDSEEINNWSLACQVWKILAQWNAFWAKVMASGQAIFTYFLIDGPDLISWGQAKGLW